MHKRSVLNSTGITELRRKKNTARKKKAVLFFIILILVFIASIFISKINDLNIKKIVISGNLVIDTKNIEEIVNEHLSGKYFFFFPKTNFILYPKNKIENELTKKYKRIKNIFINDKNLQILEIKINEYEGKYIWCGSIEPMLDSRSSQKCYFADEEGYVFDEAPYFSGEIYLKLYGEINDNINPTGYYYFKEDFPNLVKFKNALEEMELKPAYIYVNKKENEAIFGLSKLGSNISPTIFIKLDSNIEKITENIKSAIETEPLNEKIKNNYQQLKYIDLRYGNKVYYKF